MTAAELAERLHGSRSGSGWAAHCPAHEDKKPSLSIHERDGKILLHCHAGCATEKIVATAGFKICDLFTEGKPRRGIAATYDYTNERGDLMFQVVRLVPKSFKQRRPDGRGRWIW